MLKLGDQHRPLEESLEVEFKEFCLHEISNKNINQCIKTGKIKDVNIFNKDIYNNITHYFYKYIPKYVSAFINAKINGELIVGVNDYGEITGVPFIGSKIELQKYINNININKFLRYNTNKPYDIKCEIQELTIDMNYIDNISDKLLTEYYKNLRIKNFLIKKYKQDRLDWVKQMDSYTCKLSVLLSSKKAAFDEYLQIHAPQHLNYIIKENEMTSISHLKVDKSHYIYWLMQFKDSNLERIKKMKPEIPELPKVKNDPEYIYKHLTNLRYKLLESNTNLNYFIINIKIHKTQYDEDVMYYNMRKKMWIKKIRKLNDDGPKCETSE